MGFFYVKAGLGTRTSGGELTQQTGSFTSLGAGSVYADIATALADAAPPNSGDYICCSSAHAKTYTTTQVLNIPTGVTVVSVDDANCDAVLTGASEITSSGNLGLSLADATSVVHESMSYESEDDMLFYRNSESTFNNCNIGPGNQGSASGSDQISVGNADSPMVTFNNCVLTMPDAIGTAILVLIYGVHWQMNGGSIGLVTNKPDFLVDPQSSVSGVAEFNGVDLSNMDSGFSIVENPSSADDLMLVCLRNCKMPATWSFGGTLYTGGRILIENCDNGDNRYISGYKDMYGYYLTQTTVYRTAADTVDGTNVAQEIVTTSMCSFESPFRFRLGVVKADFSTSKDITVYFTHNALGSETGNLFSNDECWIEVYVPNASDPGMNIETTAKATVFTTAAAVGSETTSLWTTPEADQEKIVLSTTASQGEGWAEVYVCIGKASVVAGDLYVCPDIEVA